MFHYHLIRHKVAFPGMFMLTIAIEAWLKTSSARGSEIRLYMERAQDIWHPTVSVLPKRILPPTPNPIVNPVRHSEEMKDSKDELSNHSLGYSSSLSNGVVNSTDEKQVEWPDVGKLPGVYSSRHDASMILIFLKWF